MPVDDAVQFGDAGLEQFIAGKCFEDVLQRFAVVTVGGQRKMLRHLRDFVAQHRDVAWIAVVGRGGP